MSLVVWIAFSDFSEAINLDMVSIEIMRLNNKSSLMFCSLIMNSEHGPSIWNTNFQNIFDVVYPLNV